MLRKKRHHPAAFVRGFAKRAKQAAKERWEQLADHMPTVQMVFGFQVKKGCMGREPGRVAGESAKRSKSLCLRPSTLNPKPERCDPAQFS